MIARARLRGQLLHQRIDASPRSAARVAHAAHRACQDPSPNPSGAKNQLLSAASSAGASCSRCTPSFMVLERGSSTAMMRALPTRARKPAQRGLDGRRMMREIIVHRHAIDHAAYLHAALDAAKRIQRLRGTLRLHAGVLRGGDCRQRIHDIVFADQFPRHLGDRAALENAPRSGSPQSPSRSARSNRKPAPSAPIRRISRGVQQPSLKVRCEFGILRRSRSAARLPARCAAID